MNTQDFKYQREFHLKLDRECQEIMDSCYAMISTLDYYENDCKFEMTEHIKEFKRSIFNMLKTYEERYK